MRIFFSKLRALDVIAADSRRIKQRSRISPDLPTQRFIQKDCPTKFIQKIKLFYNDSQKQSLWWSLETYRLSFLITVLRSLTLSLCLSCNFSCTHSLLNFLILQFFLLIFNTWFEKNFKMELWLQFYCK